MDVQMNPAATEAQSLPQPDPRRWLMLVVVFCAGFLDVLDNFIINVALPSIGRELHASFGELQLAVAGYTLAYAVLLVTGGRLGDLYGRKRLFVLGIGGFTLFSAGCGVAPTTSLLIISRILQGASAALMYPQVMSFIQVTFTPAERPRIFGYYAAIAGLASILGQVFGGFLLTANLFDTGWRSIFLVNVPIGLLVFPAALLVLRESKVAEARRLDYGGVGLLTLALFLCVCPLVMGESAGWPWWMLLCLLLSIPALIAFLLYEQKITRQGRTPLVSLLLFRRRRFSSGLVTITLSSGLFTAMLFLLTFYLQTLLHLTPLQAGLVFMVSSISFILASLISPAVSIRLGKRGLPVSAALVTLSYLLLVLAAQFLVPLWGIPPLLVALFASGFGMGLLGTPLLAKTLEDIKHDDAGVASGIYSTVQQTAGAFGVTILGLLDTFFTLSSGSPLHAFVLTMAVIMLLSCGLWLSVRPIK
ncbi:MFS transporter [Dictyobacter sp. S3.2.2.5]|uniref:MFS transporter n=1 Tax=Dictyobacter halimunensis TaxID=3026934 RepID=A0ABQ6FMP1_9CHLR|nr:MFS transporter [Dictyobacter sp. S3.2.2.5]